MAAQICLFILLVAVALACIRTALGDLRAIVFVVAMVCACAFAVSLGVVP